MGSNGLCTFVYMRFMHGMQGRVTGSFFGFYRNVIVGGVDLRSGTNV
jgi:hypothetical protein